MPTEQKTNVAPLPRYDWSRNKDGSVHMQSYPWKETVHLFKATSPAYQKQWIFMSGKRKQMLQTAALPEKAPLKVVDDAVIKFVSEVNTLNHLCMLSSIVVCISTSYTLTPHY